MFPGRIPLIVLPIIVRILLVKRLHYPVALGFSEDRCRSYRHIDSIALHKTLMGYSIKRIEPVAIDQEQVWFMIQLFYGPVHGQKGGCLKFHRVS